MQLFLEVLNDVLECRASKRKALFPPVVVVVRYQTESLPISFRRSSAGRRFLSSTLGVFRPLFENLRAWAVLQLLPSLGQIQFASGLRADRTLGFGLFLLQLLLENFDACPKLHPGQRDFAPFVLHLGKDAFLLSLLGG